MASGPADRVILATAALCGGAGVILGAVAAHGAEGSSALNLTFASSFLLFHAPAVIALGAHIPRVLLIRAAQGAMLAGAVLFSGSLAASALTGIQIRPSPAPLGGILLIFGWALAAAHFLTGGGKDSHTAGRSGK